MSDKNVSEMTDAESREMAGAEIRELAGAASPADELRKAASLIRERAGLVPPSPWYAALHDVTTYDGLDVIASSGLTVRAQYVASWQPSVALAVADWLENEADAADLVQRTAIDPHEMLGLPDRHALAVARAVLESAR